MKKVILFKRAINIVKIIFNKLISIFHQRRKYPERNIERRVDQRQIIGKRRQDLKRTRTIQVQKKIQKSKEETFPRGINIQEQEIGKEVEIEPRTGPRGHSKQPGSIGKPEEVEVTGVRRGKMTTIKKPYKKKTPTEKRKQWTREPLARKKKESSPSKSKKDIDLGDIRRKRSRSSETRSPPSLAKKDKILKEREVTERVQSPYVEINLDEAKIYVVLPQQQFKISPSIGTARQLTYDLRLNGKEQKIVVKLVSNQSLARSEERRIYVEKPLANFQVVFPAELGTRRYSYNHRNKNFYAFVAIGDNRGRMHYLYDEDGNVSPFSKRDVWMLLDEIFKPNIEPDIIEETWIWEKYQPMRINLKQADELILRNKETKKEEKVPCEPTFSVEGQLTEDDFKKESPLFTDGTLNVTAPYENRVGWVVWIQNKTVGHRIVSKNWTGAEPLSLKTPDDLPCECGEFQVDICRQDRTIPDGILFFRWLPFIELNYPKELIIPNPHQGHKAQFVKVKLNSNGECEFKDKNRLRIGSLGNSSYQIEMLPKEDILRFSIFKKTRPETKAKLQITIPRLKWKISKQESWSGKLQKIERKELTHEEDLNLFLRTNDFNNRYNFLARLETNHQTLQERKFIPRGMEYILELNRFYDTIDENKDELTLKVEIKKSENNKYLDVVDVLHFAGQAKIIKKKVEKNIYTKRKPTPFIHTIYPQVMMVMPNRGGTREGKGFSEQEIIATGTNIKELKRLNISFDKRRKSSHPWNIKTLKSLIQGDNHGNRSS